MSGNTQGLYEKFLVKRTDGSSEPGCKHYLCRYFVLDLTHDLHAIPAILAYARSCRDENLQLSDNLYSLAKEER